MIDLNKDYFDFVCPTRMIYRPNSIGSIGKIIREDYQMKKVVFIYGGSSLKTNGAYEKITTSFKENGVSFIEYGGIKSNPDVEDVEKIVEEAREFKPDLILGCGGGSVLDTAKCVAHAYYYQGNPIDFCRHTVTPLHALPIATIITLCASGSEMSDSCVISDRKHHFKGGFNIVSNYPLFSLLDPTLTFTVSSYQTAIGLIDMFSHSFERYFSPSHLEEPCDGLALSVMRDIVSLSSKVIMEPTSLEYRRSMMILGSLAHDGFTNYGKKKLFIVHGAEHYLSGRYPSLIHGQGIALLLVPYLTENITLFKEKIIRMGQEVFKAKREESAEKCISLLNDWLLSLPVTHSFDQLNMDIKKEDVDKAISFLKIKG